MHGEDDGYYDLIQKIRDTNKLLNETFIISQDNWDNFLLNLDDLVDYCCEKQHIKSNDIYLVSRMYALMNSTYLTRILGVAQPENQRRGNELTFDRLPMSYIKTMYNDSVLGHQKTVKKLPPSKDE